MTEKQQDALAGWLFMTPTILILGGFLFIPMLFALYYSFTDWNGINPPSQANFVGMVNYYTLLFEGGVRQADFFKALKNTTYYAIFVVPLQTFLALTFAVVINQRQLRFKQFFRVAYYFPSITSSIAISLIFLFLYQKDGLINHTLGFLTFGAWQPIAWLNDSRGVFHLLLELLGITLATGPEFLQANLLGLTVWDWISGPSVAMVAIMLMNTWTTIGTMMIIFIAALQDVPGQVYEAAQIDGATPWQSFWYITLPLLRSKLFFVVTLGLIGSYQMFDQVFVMSNGGPAKTTMTMAYIVYRNGFRNNEMGVGAATAILLFAIIFILTMVQRRITEGEIS